MSWRTVVISNRCKLDLKMGYLVIRTESTKRIYLDEISTLIIEDTAVCLTGCLIEALNEKKIKTIFCDNKRNPMCELIPYYGCHDNSQKIKMQMNWSNQIKGIIWTNIISEKIRKQSDFLRDLNKNKESDLLNSYITQLEFYDYTNREGHAAKVYFNAIFGMSFNRSDGTNIINTMLNYGYTLILSLFNREICANGYLTQLGLFHNNMFNHFNLSSDLMEPFRILVDRFVYSLKFEKFETNEKHKMLEILQKYVIVDGCRQVLPNAIKIYVKSIFDALNDGDESKIKFVQYEL